MHFFAINLEKFYTGQNFFTQAPPVVPVTNMRYGLIITQITINTEIGCTIITMCLHLDRGHINNVIINHFTVQASNTIIVLFHQVKYRYGWQKKEIYIGGKGKGTSSSGFPANTNTNTKTDDKMQHSIIGKGNGTSSLGFQQIQLQIQARLTKY